MFDMMKTLEVFSRYIGSGNILLQEFIDSHLLHVVLHPSETGIGGGRPLSGPVRCVGSAGRARFSWE